MDQYRHNWYVHDSMQFARELFFADMKAKPDKQQIDAYVNDSLIPIMYLQVLRSNTSHCVAMLEAMKHQARVNPNYRQNNLPDGI